MLSVEEARKRILSFFEVLPLESSPILDAQGQVLAEDVTGPFDIPPLDNSAMDGFAVQTASVKDATAASPVLLEVVGSVAAGEMPMAAVGAGTAVRIMTGAPVPEGADAVVPFEDTDEHERKASGARAGEVGIRVAVEEGENVRLAGKDVKCGERVLDKGTVLRPAEIGVLASLGYAHVRVTRRPVVAILATGDELVELDADADPGKIYDSNSYTIVSAVNSAGGTPLRLGIAMDDLKSLEDKLDGAANADMLITTAGVSKGDYDMVKDVLANRGTVEFWSVRMRPAKPLAFGTIRVGGGKTVPHLGLPGNPVSALVAFEQFGRPAIYKMLGRGESRRPTIQAVLEDPIYNTDGRRVYARAVVSRRNGGYVARLTGDQSSNLLTSMARANGLAICPEDVQMKKAGETVNVEMLDWPEDVF
jgi:molybdopterin molybdotransferase